MPRPRLRRRLLENPYVTFYKPQGVPLRNLETIELSHEEWEALRLKHLLEMEQTEIAEKMSTSQSTVQRILKSSQKKLAIAIIKGCALKINKEK